LINAYKTASVLALQMVPTIQKPITTQLKIEFDYQLINEVMIIVKQCQCNVISQEINLFSNLTLEVPKSREKEVVFRLEDIKNLIILPEKTKKAK